MRRASVVDMGIEAREGMTLLLIRLAEPAAQLSASLFAHDLVDVAWRGAFSLVPTEDPLVWVTRWNPDPGLPPLLEVGNVTIDDPSWVPLEPGPTRWMFLRTGSGEDVWISGKEAQAERERLDNLRHQHFAAALVAPETPHEAPEYYILAIADNLFLTREHRVPGITLSPIKSALGSDIWLTLSWFLLKRGFGQYIKPDKWMGRMQADRPAVLIECRVKAEKPDAARKFGSEVISQMLDLMTLKRRAAARLIGGVVGEPLAGNSYGVCRVWIEHSGYTGNLAGGIISGENIHELQAMWDALQANPRAQLWASLHSDAVRDSRWDYKFFRNFALLEAIADEVVPHQEIRDTAGELRLMPDGKPFTTKQTRGKVYALLIRQAVLTPQSPATSTSEHADGEITAADQLWGEIGTWVQVRNDVAHEGGWQLPHPAEKPAHAAAHAAIMSRGHDGTFESGAQALVNSIQDVVRSVLIASIHGTL